MRRFFMHYVLHADDPPHKLALGFAIGIFITMTPAIGFQMLLVWILAWICRANKTIGLPVVWISNPATMVPIYYPCYLVGRTMLGQPPIKWHWWRELAHPPPGVLETINFYWDRFLQVAAPLWLGSIVVGALLAVPSYYAVYHLIVLHRQRRRKRSLPPRRAAATIATLALALAGSSLAFAQPEGGQRAADPIDLAVQRARDLAQEALAAAPERREPLWEEADGALEGFAERHPQHERLGVLRLHQAMLSLSRGEQLRHEAELAADQDAAYDAARRQLREAVRQLEGAQDQLHQAATRGAGVRPASQAERQVAQEALGLRDQARRQLARAHRNQALSYPPDSPDRVAALTQAIERLGQVLAATDSQSDLWRECQLDLVACERLLANRQGAEERLARLEAEAWPEPLKRRRQVERARLELAAGRAQAALAALPGAEDNSAASPEEDLTRLQAQLALWSEARQAGDAGLATSWQQRALATARQIEDRHGMYWRRQADTLLAAASGKGDAGYQVLARAADERYRRGQLDEAAREYAKAAEEAEKLGDAGAAFELSVKAALVDRQQGRHRPAADRLRQAARKRADLEQAPQAHLTAIWSLRQLAESDPDALDEYVALMEEHVSLWPEAPSADSAHLWLGMIREHQAKLSEATAAYQSVRIESEAFERAVAGAVRCWDRRLSELPAKGEPVEALLEEASAWLAKAAGPLDDRSAPWTSARRSAALGWAKLLQRSGKGNPATIERILQAGLRGQPPASNEWRAEALPLLTLALAAQPARREAAQTVAMQLASQSPERLAELTQSLAALAQSEPPGARQTLAEVMLAVMEKLRGELDQLEPDAQVRVRLAHAEALAAAGQREKAADRYRALAEEQPGDGDVQAAYAEFLSAGGDVASLQSALAQWRLVGAKSRSGSELWLRSKRSICELQLRQGEREAAVQLARYILATQPNLAPAWKRSFEQILASDASNR